MMKESTQKNVLNPMDSWLRKASVKRKPSVEKVFFESVDSLISINPLKGLIENFGIFVIKFLNTRNHVNHQNTTSIRWLAGREEYLYLV